MIAPAIGLYVVWGKDARAMEWESYWPPHISIDDAMADCRAMRDARPDRVYGIWTVDENPNNPQKAT